MATREQLLEIIGGELSAAARSAHEVHTRLIIVQKALMDVPEAVMLDDVKTLLAVSHAVIDAEASLLAVADRLEVSHPIARSLIANSQLTLYARRPRCAR